MVKNGRDPRWDEHVYLNIPREADSRNLCEYYVHIKVWSYDYVRENQLIGQMVYPLARILDDEDSEERSFPLLPTDSKLPTGNAKIYITFRTERKDEQLRATTVRQHSAVFRFAQNPPWRKKQLED